MVGVSLSICFYLRYVTETQAIGRARRLTREDSTGAVEVVTVYRDDDEKADYEAYVKYGGKIGTMNQIFMDQLRDLRSAEVFKTWSLLFCTDDLSTAEMLLEAPNPLFEEIDRSRKFRNNDYLGKLFAVELCTDIASQRRLADIITFLSESPLLKARNINLLTEVDNNGRTLLSLVCEYGLYLVAERLLTLAARQDPDHHPDGAMSVISATDKYGARPHEWCVYRDRKDIGPSDKKPDAWFSNKDNIAKHLMQDSTNKTVLPRFHDSIRTMRLLVYWWLKTTEWGRELELTNVSTMKPAKKKVQLAELIMKNTRQPPNDYDCFPAVKMMLGLMTPTPDHLFSSAQLQSGPGGDNEHIPGRSSTSTSSYESRRVLVRQATPGHQHRLYLSRLSERAQLELLAAQDDFREAHESLFWKKYPKLPPTRIYDALGLRTNKLDQATVNRIQFGHPDNDYLGVWKVSGYENDSPDRGKSGIEAAPLEARQLMCFLHYEFRKIAASFDNCNSVFLRSMVGMFIMKKCMRHVDDYRQESTT